MKWDLKITHPTTQVLEEIDRSGYPFQWTLDMLERHTFFLRGLTERRETIGYFWFSVVPETYRMYELHFCVLPEYQRVWFDRSVVKKLEAAARLIDADSVLVFHPQNIERLRQLKLLGFRVHEPFAIYDIGDSDGRSSKDGQAGHLPTQAPAAADNSTGQNAVQGLGRQNLRH